MAHLQRVLSTVGRIPDVIRAYRVAKNSKDKTGKR